ncbi:unnamed protein product, partial [Adineta steineri]
MSMRKALGQEPSGTMYDEQERQKTLRLNREVREQPQEPRLEWIYTGDRAKTEDYLLGKKYDADVQSNPVPEENTTTSTIDLANKIREDPLYLIKKKEIEQKKKILDNPVRLKQLKELLERQESAQSSSHRKKRHSRSRSPPRHHHHKRDSPSSQRQRRRSPSPPRRRPSPSSRRQSPPPRRQSPPPRRQSPSSRRQSPPARRQSPPSRRKSPPPRRERTPPRSNNKRPEKLSKEERERRIREMLVDGTIRNEQRQQNVRIYKERDDEEEKANILMKERAKKKNDLSSSDDEEQDFIRPMMRQVVDDPSLKRRD